MSGSVLYHDQKISSCIASVQLTHCIIGTHFAQYADAACTTAEGLGKGESAQVFRFEKREGEPAIQGPFFNRQLRQR